MFPSHPGEFLIRKVKHFYTPVSSGQIFYYLYVRAELMEITVIYLRPNPGSVTVILVIVIVGPSLQFSSIEILDLQRRGRYSVSFMEFESP